MISLGSIVYNSVIIKNGILHIFSVLFLTFVVSLTFSMLEFDKPKQIMISCAKWWGKFVGGLFIVAVVVQLLSSI